ncbi:hypothetical protein B0I35DRAFT_431610 [Stachybotrys elegans]|uniref:BZIP domain-containing protein n=1 Tax=Stachybotrys elegans TaxID=80388 RepID=A0A8K0SUV4_9HYPO|nr:hypothetical protein B0I35DRAFT_431610 [Stachybotrys elegans]
MAAPPAPTPTPTPAPPHQRTGSTASTTTTRSSAARSSPASASAPHPKTNQLSLSAAAPKSIRTAPPQIVSDPQRPLAQPIGKMATTVIAPQGSAVEGPRMSMTSKEWVIPPRPKPGRKPATDTPPTKRKAQNRAAQRAFRERRAARVGELEEQLDQQRHSYENTELELKEKIRGLELDLQSFRSRCSLLENMLERERQERIRAETEAEALRRQNQDAFYRQDNATRSRHQSFDRQHRPSQQLSPTALPGQQPPHQPGQNMPISQLISPAETLDDQSDQAFTCGNCSVDGPCPCAEEVLASVNKSCGKCGMGSPCQCLEATFASFDQVSGLKRPLSPTAPTYNEKRQRPSQDSSETDMPAVFSTTSVPSLSDLHNPLPISQSTHIDSMALKDGCGFCKEGTYCVCADAAMSGPVINSHDTLPPITQQVQTPPPSESDVFTPPLAMEITADGAVKLPPRRNQKRSQAPTTSRSCGPNGPGTCAQCQADPKSGLFCRLMAARFDSEQGGASSGGGCCGGKGPDGGCCKSTARKEKITLPSLPSLGLSCAEAYQTLSSHRNFEKAADDIGSWLPKLRATSTGGQQAAPRGRQDIEVEAASIMSVLKDFDVRFGREA